MPGRVEINKAALMDFLHAKAVKAAETTGEDIKAMAQARAPVGTNRKSKPRAVVVRKPRDVSPAFRAQTQILRTEQLTEPGKFNLKVLKRGHEQSFAKSFKFRSGGGEVSKVSFGPRGGLVGHEATGHLRDSITATIIDDGVKVTCRIGSDLRYAAAQEKGFDHHSHGKSTGVRVSRKGYLRPAFEQYKRSWVNASAFKR